MQPSDIQRLTDFLGLEKRIDLSGLFGVDPRTIQRWAAGTREIHPILDYVSAIIDELSDRRGEAYARELMLRAAERIGRRPGSRDE